LNEGGDATRLATLLPVVAAGVRWTEPSLWLNTFLIDVTGDTVDDVVLELSTATDKGNSSGVFIVSCRQGLFQTAFANSIPPGPNNPTVDLAGLVDMNGNGVADTVYSEVGYGATGNSFTSFYIVEWDGQAFAQLLPDGPGGGAGMFELYFVGNQQDHHLATDIETMFPDVDGNGTRELVLIGGVDYGLGDYPPDGPPQRLQVDTWAWNGQAFTLRLSEFEPPVYRIEAALDGDAATLRGDYERALDFYQQAVFDEDLIEWSSEMLEMLDEIDAETIPSPAEERSRLNAYGRYRILLIHAILRNTDGVQIVYETLRRVIPRGSAGYPYVALADAFWEGLEAGGSVAAGCQRARANAAEHPDEVLAPLGSSMYGYNYEDYTPQDICPFD
jgi:hypothetical protein